jgi:uncharacterized protein YcfL
MRRFLVVALVSVTLAACSSSGDAASSTTEGKKYVDALMKSYSASAAKKSITESEARCLSEATIDAAGIDALKTAKVMPADLFRRTRSPKSRQPSWMPTASTRAKCC